MATEEEASESVKAAEKNDKTNGSTIAGKTVNNSVLEAEQNVNISEAPQSSPQGSTIIGSTLTSSENRYYNQYFFEDQVFFIDKNRVKFGLIIDTCDSYSGDEDDVDDDEKLSRGDVRVAWYPHGREHVRSEDTIGLADRTLMPGDVVRRMTAGCNPQRGYVRDIKITADIKVIGAPYVIRNVAAERLRPISIWQRDCTVCLDSWVGSAKDVDERAVLKGVNGVRFEIQSSDFYHFKETATSRRPSVFSPLIFFPGNIVVGRLPSTEKANILTPDIPLPLNRKGAMLKGKFLVESVRTEGVIVQWQCKALSKSCSKNISELEPPKPYISADQLDRVKRLNVFESCVLQIADRSYLNFESKDVLISKSRWEREIASSFKLLYQQQKKAESGKKQRTATKYSKSTSKSLKVVTSENSNVEKSSADKIENDNEKSDGDKDISYTTEGEWVDTTTTATTDTSELSEGESGSAGNDEEDHSDMESNSKNSYEKMFENTSVDSSGKLNVFSTSMVKKLLANRNKTNLHPRVRENSAKWPLKNSYQIPFNYKCSVPEGKELITETLLVYSKVSVVWQDGTVENDIPSTHLYPIHHLDNHEFFPGDFTMLSREDPNITFRDYGVIQTVDHQGRTAHVKWFKTYTSEDEPNFSPMYKGESEVSVYDLKDHPDFTYRPGGMVIRVSNFTGDDAVCTAGQVLDNCTDGRVKIAWVDGHISCCYPQDLFDVGHHEQNDYVGDSDSWETQSENSGVGGDDEEEELENQEMPCAESDIVVNMDRARSAIALLEDILKANPQLQTRNVVRKLLLIYKTGRYIDRLMQTTYFHEDQFWGLVDRMIREDPDLNATENTKELRIALETLSKGIKNESIVNTLPVSMPDDQSPEINVDETIKPTEKTNLNPETNHLSSIGALGNSNTPKVLLNVGSRYGNNSNNVSGSGGSKGSNNSNVTTPARHLRNCTYTTHVLHVRNDASYTQMCGPDAPKSLYSVLPASDLEKLVDEDKQQIKDPMTGISSSSNPTEFYSAEKNHLLSSALLSIEKAYQVTNSMKTNVEALLSQDDSGTFSRNNSDASNNAAESDTLLDEIPADSTTPSTKVVMKKIENTSVFDMFDITEFADNLPPLQFCIPFCIMLREQLQKCLNEIELQSTRFTTYKSLVVPHSTNQSADKEPNNITVAFCDGEDLQSQSQMDSTTLSNSNESAQNVQLVNTETKIDVSNDSAPETWIVPDECFKILPNAPKNHKFYTSNCEPSQPQHYFRAVQREHRLLKTSLPKGIWLRFYEDRIDLLSVMMEGPKKTPYENGLYFFDLQLDQDYPKRPPVCHYISYCVDRLNPNLYEEGKVCVSLLGTWSGRDVEIWGSNSTLLQVLVSIQGLILVPEPYFNEAGYEKQKGSLQGFENSRMYNEMVVIKVTQATMKMLSNPPAIFLDEIIEYYKQNGLQMYERIKGWLELSKAQIQAANIKQENVDIDMLDTANIEYIKPDFPLLPASRGFCLTLDGLLKSFKEKIDIVLITKSNQNNVLASNTQPECKVEVSKQENQS